MSYGFYVYTDRASIKTTKVYSQTSGKTYSYSYGTGQQTLNGFTDGDYLNFTAVPADGYEFKRWIYHIGSPSATTQYSTSNPFKYYGSTGNDIYIAAEGQATSGGGDSGGDDTTTEWTLSNSYITDPDTTQYIVFDLGKMECRRIRMLFATTGQVTISSSGGKGLNAYLGKSSSFSSSTGLPGDYNTSKINCDTFSFSFNCTDTNQPWYLWVRPTSESASVSNITVTIVPPKAATVDYFKWSSAVAQGLHVKNVSHTEWDSFIDKIIEVITAKGNQNQPITEAKYGYPVGTTYLTMLRDCYMSYDTALQGYPLTAKKFNVARFIIGSNVSTGISDKTSKTSQLLASDLLKLESCLKTWQG